MRFLVRNLTGLFLTALSMGLLALAGFQVWQAIEARRAGPGPARAAEEQVVGVRLQTLAPGRVVPEMQVFGTVRSRRELQLRVGAAGRIVELDPAMVEGGRVRAGQVLVRLDPATAEAARDNAEAALEEARARQADAERAVGIARDDLTAAETQARLRGEALERQRRLADRGLGTGSEREAVELAQSAAEQAVLARRGALASAEGAVTSAGIAVRRAGIALAEARRALDDTVIAAGFDGRVTAVTAVEGALVTPNEQVARLIDPDALEVEVPLSLDQYARLAAEGTGPEGRTARVVLDGSAGRIVVPATLDRAAASVAEGAAGRTVFARIDRPDARLRPGDFVAVEIDEPPIDAAATLPAAALGADGTVLVLGEGDRLVATPVRLLRRQGDAAVVEVPPELAGARIVTERGPQLGTGIRVRDADAPPADPPADASPDRPRPSGAAADRGGANEDRAAAGGPVRG